MVFKYTQQLFNSKIGIRINPFLKEKFELVCLAYHIVYNIF